MSYEKGYVCRTCGAKLPDNYPFTYCDDCFPNLNMKFKKRQK